MKREYPEAPIVGVGAIVLDAGRILLVRRGHPPSQGLWTFPGGAVELGERVHDAVRREVLEETGLLVEVGDVAAVVDMIARDQAGRVQYHYLIVDYLAHPIGGTLGAGTDAADVCWAAVSDLDTLDITDKARHIARTLLAEQRDLSPR